MAMVEEIQMDDFSRPDNVATDPAFTDDTPFNTYTPETPRVDDIITTPGISAETSFTTGNVDAYGQQMRPSNDLVYVEGKYEDVFNMDLVPFEKQAIAGAANDYYRKVAQQQNLAPEVPNLENFYLDTEGRLRLKDHPDVNLINETDSSSANLLTSIANRKGGRKIVREKLGFSSWTPKMSKTARESLLNARQNLINADSTLGTDSIENSGQAADEAVKSAQKIVAVLVRDIAPVIYKVCARPWKGPGGNSQTI